MIKLRYGNTNTFLIPCHNGFLLLDTDYAGTLPAFYKAIKQNGIKISDIVYVLATHYHPDHMGLIPDLMKLGVRLLLIDTQWDSVHFSDSIFARDGLPFAPIDETQATVIRCEESRQFLSGIGIGGEIIAAPSHSPDSISLLLDGGDAFVGDLQPYEYLDDYDANDAAKADWTRIHCFHSERIFYAHAN
ncbi:MAG: MBL fold metallo-hydrolase [Clostridia bacterium]|nr:MBL fold metallo-hydrolase [Clostridia bacterium]